MIGLTDLRSHSKSGPFGTQPLRDHSRLVQISDPHCTKIWYSNGRSVLSECHMIWISNGSINLDKCDCLITKHIWIQNRRKFGFRWFGFGTFGTIYSFEYIEKNMAIILTAILFLDHSKTELFFLFSNGGSNSVPFFIWTPFNHPKSECVRNSSPHCTTF